MTKDKKPRRNSKEEVNNVVIDQGVWPDSIKRRSSSREVTEGEECDYHHVSGVESEVDIEALYDRMLPLILGPSLQQAEDDFANGHTFSR